MTEEELNSLEKEKMLCLRELRACVGTLTTLDKQREQALADCLRWKKRYEDADRKIAMETKLTVVRRGEKGRTTGSLEAVLKDKEKVKKLIKLLGEEIGKPCTVT